MRRLTDREHLLLYLFAFVLFAMANLILIPQLLAWQLKLKESIDTQESNLALNRQWALKLSEWREKEQWMNVRLPVLDNPNLAQAALLLELQKCARNVGVEVKEQGATITPVQDGETNESSATDAASRPWIKIGCRIKVQGSLENVTRMATALHQPKLFQTIWALSIVGDLDPTKVTCEIKVIRWYRAP